MTEGTVYSMLVICGISHFLNDMIQSIIPSIYPILKANFDFSFAQIGLITLVFQMTSSILQPFTGLYADRHPRPYALSVGMCFTLTDVYGSNAVRSHSMTYEDAVNGCHCRYAEHTEQCREKIASEKTRDAQRTEINGVLS